MSFREQLTTARMRWSNGSNSFQWSFGVGERLYRFSLGDDVLKDVPGGSSIDTSYEVLEIKNWVALGGLGNRWQFDPGFVIGVDWLDLIMPFGQGSTRSAIYDEIPGGRVKRGLHSVLSGLRYGPTIDVLRFHVGWAF